MFVNIFALHYFLWFAGLTSIYGYIGVYAKHYADASASSYGTLNMVLPFVTILAKLFFCSLADRYRVYRTFFIWFLVIALIGWGSFGILPLFIEPPVKNSGLVVSTWVMICIMTSISIISMSVISCLSDAFAMNSSKRNNSSYGFIRLWGTLGWGISAFALAFINQADMLPYLVPGLFVTIVLLGSDIIAIIFWPYKSDFELDKSASDVDFEAVVSVLAPKDDSTDSINVLNDKRENNGYGTTTGPSTSTVELGADQSESIQQVGEISNISVQWSLFKEVANMRRSLYRYLILFTISGALISIQWSYFFLYLENLDPQEQKLAFISGISMVGQSMLGELPFFILSKFVVGYLGRSHTLSFSFIAIGIRYLLYVYLLPNSSQWFILLTESFQGPSFGLFYVVLTEVGLDYSDCEAAIIRVAEKGTIKNNPNEISKLRQALRATMQSLMSACYEGLGVGIGNILGGYSIDYFGYDNLWFWAAMVAIFVGILNILIEVLNLPLLADIETDLVSKKLESIKQRQSTHL